MPESSPSFGKLWRELLRAPKRENVRRKGKKKEGEWEENGGGEGGAWGCLSWRKKENGGTSLRKGEEEGE